MLHIDKKCGKKIAKNWNRVTMPGWLCHQETVCGDSGLILETIISVHFPKLISMRVFQSGPNF